MQQTDIKASQILMKKTVAEEAVNKYIKDNMVVGLGTGSTSYYAISKIGELASNGYDLTCIATSKQSEMLAKSFGLKISNIDEVTRIDITIDGADEVDSKMHILKGLGGALLREKIVASSTLKEIIIVDSNKLVRKLGTKAPLPVEVVPFGHCYTCNALKKLGCEPELRKINGIPFTTDNGNYIYDCAFNNGIDDPYRLESDINNIVGVIENGLFLNIAHEVLVCDERKNITSIQRPHA